MRTAFVLSLSPLALIAALVTQPTAAAGPGLGPGGTLGDVVTVSPTSAWAVGGDSDYHTMAMYYDGRTWSTVPAWTPRTDDFASFVALSLDSSGTPWAAGSGQTKEYPSYFLRPIVARWNGRKFVKMPVQKPDIYPGGWFSDISALSPTNVWAVGGYVQKRHATRRYGPLVEHWDGTSFHIVQTGPKRGAFDAVLALAADDVWAVGVDRSGGTLAMHWDGMQWTRIPMPNPGSGANSLSALSGTSASDVWAVGGQGSGVPLIEHWDGSSWSLVQPPSGAAGSLNDVCALAANKVWAVGSDDAGSIILHWNGSSWIELKASPGGPLATLNGVDADAPKDAWTVGRTDIDMDPYETVLAHWDGRRWTEYDANGG